MAGGGVVVAVCVARERKNTGGRVAVAASIAFQRFKTVGRVVAAGGVAKKRVKTGGRVGGTGGEAEESILALSGVVAGIASVWWWVNRLDSRRKPKAAERGDDEKITAPPR